MNNERGCSASSHTLLTGVCRRTFRSFVVSLILFFNFIEGDAPADNR